MQAAPIAASIMGPACSKADPFTDPLVSANALNSRTNAQVDGAARSERSVQGMVGLNCTPLDIADPKHHPAGCRSTTDRQGAERQDARTVQEVSRCTYHRMQIDRGSMRQSARAATAWRS
jgi:hypothetical protein